MIRSEHLRQSLSLIINKLSLKIATGKQPQVEFEGVRLGSDYGGYHVPTWILDSRENKILISGGLGFDISFDLSLVKHGFKVIGVEPVIESVAWVKNEIRQHGVDSHYSVIQKAVSDKNEDREFHAPIKSRNYHWWANQNPSDLVRESAIFPCISLEDLLTMARRQGSIVIGKFDIEGHEIDLIHSVIDLDLSFDWLIIEMDYLNLVKTSNLRKKIVRAIQIRRLMTKMNASGYAFNMNEEFNFFWSRSNFKTSNNQ